MFLDELPGFPDNITEAADGGFWLALPGPRTEEIDNYSKNLNEIKEAIKNKDSKKLLEIFSSTKKVRKEIIEAGQDTDKPGFGRK